LQDAIGNGRTNLTECQEQRLCSGHIECLPILREESIFKDTGLLRAHCISEGIGDGVA